MHARPRAAFSFGWLRREGLGERREGKTKGDEMSCKLASGNSFFFFISFLFFLGGYGSLGLEN